MAGMAGRLRIGDWCVDPALGQISRAGEVVRLEARAMRLLLRLAQQPGAVVSLDALLDHVWAGVIVTPDSVYQAVTSLRRLLGDTPRQPRYIATVPRLGYRLVAEVGAWSEATDAHKAANPSPPPRFRPWRTVAGLGMAAALALALLVVAFVQGRGAPGRTAPAAAIRTLAVLPFRDMTPSMDQEVLADDLTEALIDRLGKVPGLHAAPPGSSFSLKGRRLTASQAGKALGVGFVVDGSVRRSTTSVEVVARLVRTDDGLVVWSRTYQGAVDDPSPILDGIATGVDQATTAPTGLSATRGRG